MAEESELDVSPEELSVIEFINERQLHYEVEAQKNINLEVKNKYGEIGDKVLTQLNEQLVANNYDSAECKDCGEVSQEWLEKSQEKLRNIDIFLDDTLDEIANEVIDVHCENMITFERLRIEEIIAKHTDYKVGLIPDEYYISVCKKILFIGIVDGWLTEFMFTKHVI